MRKHLTTVTAIKRETASMSLTNFVDQLGASFPSLADFSAAATADALKWTDLEQNVVYQIINTRTVNNQHGQFCLSRKLMDLAVLHGPLL